MTTRNIIHAFLLTTVPIALVILFAYTGMSKLLNHNTFLAGIRLPQALFISYAIPVVEIITALLLCFKITKALGLWCSVILMGAFTIYVVFLLSGNNLPCSCGGVISKMNWHQHLYFNGIFLLLSITALYYHRSLHVYQGVS